MKENPKTALMVVAADDDTAQYMERFLHPHTFAHIHRITQASPLTESSRRHIDDNVGAVLIASAPGLGNEQLDIAAMARAAKVPVFAWGCGSGMRLDTTSANWAGDLTDALLLASGAAVHDSMQVIAWALKMHQSLGSLPPALLPEPSGLPEELHRRILSGLRSRGSSSQSGGPTAGEAKVSLSEKGFEISVNKRSCTVDADTSTLAAALELLQQLGRTRSESTGAIEEAAPTETPELEMFLAPPSRLLSETASKKLAGFFAIQSPGEKLCHSASEAVRFALELEGKAVIKLVRPQLESKKQAEAVITNAQGAPEIKRAVHRLSKVAEALGPPKHLGYLVAPQIDGGLRVWIKMQREEHFGPVFVFGEGDSPNHKPLGALTIPSSQQQCLQILERTLGPGRTGCDKVADTFANLTRAAARLAPHLTRAEIHPLVYTPEMDSALALDVLFEITV